jgi:hypothetical protein
MIPDYTPPAVIGSLPRDNDPTPRQVAEAVAYARAMAEPLGREGILLFALDAMTAERDGFFREAGRLRDENAALKTALGLSNLELDETDRAGVARLSQ